MNGYLYIINTASLQRNEQIMLIRFGIAWVKQTKTHAKHSD